VTRLIAVTGLGAGDSRGHGGFLYDALAFPLLLKRVYDARGQESLGCAKPRLCGDIKE
jgi:hypothetical protein